MPQIKVPRRPYYPKNWKTSTRPQHVHHQPGFFAPNRREVEFQRIQELQKAARLRAEYAKIAEALKVVDAGIKEIIDLSTHVALQSLSTGKNMWDKTDIEGALIVYSRIDEPDHRFMILNRLNVKIHIEPVIPGLEVQCQEPYMVYKNKEGTFYRILFRKKEESTKMTNLLRRMVMEKSEFFQQPKRMTLPPPIPPNRLPRLNSGLTKPGPFRITPAAPAPVHPRPFNRGAAEQISKNQLLHTYNNLVRNDGMFMHKLLDSYANTVSKVTRERMHRQNEQWRR